MIQGRRSKSSLVVIHRFGGIWLGHWGRSVRCSAVSLILKSQIDDASVARGRGLARNEAEGESDVVEQRLLLLRKIDDP